MNRFLARATAALALFGAGLLLTACGNGAYGDNASAAGAQPASTTQVPASADPCTLVESSSLERAMGEPLTQEGPATSSARGTACTWSFAGDLSIPGSLTITTWQGAEFFSDALGTPLAGVGDEARTDPALGTVLFKSGEDVVLVQALPSSDIGAARDIAELAADAL